MLCCAKHIYNNNNNLILIQISELQTGKKYKHEWFYVFKLLYYTY